MCRCKCGTERIIRSDGLNNFTKDSSCGCNTSEIMRAQYANGRNTSLVDLTGMLFGRLTVLSRVASDDGRTLWKCECTCGTIVICDAGHLKNGTTKSCGCYARERNSEARLIDLTDKTFGEWTVIRRAQDHITPKGAKAPKWHCKCSCGTERDVFGVVLRNGSSKSCGCITASRGESAIADILKASNVAYQTEYSFPDLFASTGFPLRFGFCIFDKEKIIALIEYQGEQHYKASRGGFGDAQRLYTDPKKRNYCIEHGLTLYEIRYDEDIAERMHEILMDLELLQDNSVPSSDDSEKV